MLDDINLDPEGYFGDQADPTVRGGGMSFLKLTNRDPQGKSKHEPGKLVNTKTEEMWDSLAIVPLYITPMRTKPTNPRAGDFKPDCQSADSEYPSLKVDTPYCSKLKAEDVAKVLEGYRIDKARIPGIVEQVTQDGNLSVCSWRNPDTKQLYPLCPMARWNGDKKPLCDLKEAIVGYDLADQKMFRIDVGGGSIKLKKDYTPPLLRFKKEIQNRKLPYFHHHVVMKPVLAPSGFYVLGLEIDTYVEDEDTRKRYTELHYEAKRLYEKMNAPRTEEAEEHS